MFTLYLIRHGIAEERSAEKPDTERALTPAGRRRTAAVARRLRALDVRLAALLTSPLVRARETAELLVAAGLARGYELFAPLAPGGELAALRAWLGARGQAETVGLVGHQPGLGFWAEQLVCGSAIEGLEIKKAGVVRIALSDPQANGRLLWLLPPRVLIR